MAGQRLEVGHPVGVGEQPVRHGAVVAHDGDREQVLRRQERQGCQLEQLAPEYGNVRRRLRVVKLRGTSYHGGFHNFRIRTGGVEVYPHITPDVTAEHNDWRTVASGVNELDALLGGGLEEGTACLFIGPSGTGKTTLATLYAHAAALPGVEPVGIALHIGSQILSMAPYRAAYARAADLVRALRAAGQTVQVVDCGGGLGIPYRDEPAPSPAAFAGAIRGALGGMDLRLAVEPGRWLVGPAGLLLASVVLSKRTGERRFVVLDAAMNDLLRPALYDAWHGIVPVSAADAARPTTPADVVGPVCETGDTFARGRALPGLAPHARVAILDTGAYGSVMSSTYNARPLAAEVLVDGGRWSAIRARQPVEALWADERVPEWLA